MESKAQASNNPATRATPIALFLDVTPLPELFPHGERHDRQERRSLG